MAIAVYKPQSVAGMYFFREWKKYNLSALKKLCKDYDIADVFGGVCLLCRQMNLRGLTIRASEISRSRNRHLAIPPSGRRNVFSREWKNTMFLRLKYNGRQHILKITKIIYFRKIL